MEEYKDKEKEDIKEDTEKYYEELCFSGASQRGISYIGVLQYLVLNNKIKRDKIKKCIGTSIGTFILSIYLIGYEPNEMLKIILNTNMYELNKLKINNNNMLSIYDSCNIYNLVKTILDKKIKDCTLKMLYEFNKVEFVITVLSLKEGIIYMSYKTHPDVLLYDAITAAMSIQCVYQPYIINGEEYVDAVLFDNFPIHSISCDGLGVTTSNNNNICEKKSENMLDVLNKIMAIISKNNKKDIKCNNVIMVDTNGFNTFDLNMSNDDKLTLYMRGYESAKIYFNE